MKFNFKKITEELIPIFDTAGEESIDLYKKGLKIEIKDDGSPVSNGDIKVNDMITSKIEELTPDIPIISEETVNLKEKNKNSILIPPMFLNSWLCLSKEAIYAYKWSFKGKYIDSKDQISVKWNDKKINFNWPIKKPILSKRDK